MKDEALCRLLISDPDTGMEKLILKYGGLVSAVISGRLRSYSFSKEDIEDCSAETFFEFWRGFEKDPCRGGEIRARLCVIAKRNAIDRLRSSYRSPETLSIDDEQAKSICSDSSLEGEFEEKQLKAELISAVKALGRPDSEIIIRKYYLGQNSKEIASDLGMSVSNVDTRAHRAVKKLSALMGGKDHE